MKNTSSSINAQPALLFIPDISGFTRFISNTEIQHSQHIIEELLEIVIDANEIGLQLSEIEGDAILFYRFGKAPTAAELLAQIQKMFVSFHAHLKKYETNRICNCGACKTAHTLTLKFVAHYGNITLNRIKDRSSLFGKEVVIAHRLLKNDIKNNEYALVTNNLVNACTSWTDMDTVAWAPIYHRSQRYDSGEVSYCYISLSPLMDHVPEPKAEDFSIPGVKALMTQCEATLEAPMDMVFDVLADLSWRSKWMVGTAPVTDMLSAKITQSGSTHRCITNGPVIISHDFQTTDDRVTFSETDVKKNHCAVFTLERIGQNLTRGRVEVFMRRNWLMETIFKLFMKKKMQKQIDDSFTKLNRYCQDLLEKGEQHPYSMVLSAREESPLAAV